MKVICKPGVNEFEMASWNTDKPETVIAVLRKQLEVAKAIWPEELHGYSIRQDDPGIPY